LEETQQQNETELDGSKWYVVYAGLRVIRYKSSHCINEIRPGRVAAIGSSPSGSAERRVSETPLTRQSQSVCSIPRHFLSFTLNQQVVRIGRLHDVVVMHGTVYFCMHISMDIFETFLYQSFKCW